MTALGSQLPSWYAAAHTRNLAAAAAHRLYRLRAHGAFHIGTHGPLVLVVPSPALLAPLVVQAIAPRPVHVLVDGSAPAALPAALRRAVGAIDFDAPTAITAQRRALAALADGRAVAVCGATWPAAYLVAASGASVVAVTLLGIDGRVGIDPPRPGSAIAAYVTAPVRVEVGEDPVRRSTRTVVGERIRQVVADGADEASRRAGLPTKEWR